ncbi:MAG: hypothetical protein GXP25_18290 [Planctomycetes bacterium]|nr:hypothetical protein [Planctomycetota bacterium]
MRDREMAMTNRIGTVFGAALILSCLAALPVSFCQGKNSDIWGPNLIKNPGFENGLSAWEATERKGPVHFGADVSEKSEGEASAYLDAGGEGTVVLTQTIRVREGGTYRFAGAARCDGGSAPAGVRLRCLDHAGKRIRDIWPLHLPAWRVPWRKYEETVSVPGQTTTLQVQLLVSSGGRAQFDDLYLGRRRPYPQPAKVLAEQGWAFVSDLAFEERRGRVTRNAQTPKWRVRDPLRLNSTIYDKGIGVRANSTIVIDVAGSADLFRAVVGVDDEADKGTVRFRVYGDKKELFDSGGMKCGDPPKTIEADVGGVAKLMLVVDDARDGTADDDADWCDAILLKKDAVPPPSSGRKIARPIAGMHVKRIKTSGPVWTLMVSDLDGNGDEELILGGLDGTVTAAQKDGKVLWRTNVGGLPFAMDSGDVNGDGRREVVVCSLDVDGSVHVIDFEGKTMWSFALPDTFFTAVAVADLKNDGKAEIVLASGNRVLVVDADANPLWQKDFGGPRIGSIAVGDIVGDAQKEIVIGFRAQWMRAAALSADGNVLWTFSPAKLKGAMELNSIRIGDINSDGRQEIVFGADPQAVLAVDGNGNLLWHKEKIGARKRRDRPYFGAMLVEVADFWPDLAGLETMVLGIRDLRMLDRDGNEIWKSDSSILLLGSSLVRSPTGGSPDMFIPSSGTRDSAVYRLRLKAGEENRLADYPLEDPIGENLDELRSSLLAGAPLAGYPRAIRPEKFHVIVSVRSDPKAILATHDFLKKRESEHLEFVLMMWMKELPVELSRSGVISQEQIVSVAKLCEKNNVPFFFFVDHGAQPWITLETAEKVLAAAPNACRGFYLAENIYMYPSKTWDKFMGWTLGLLDLCAERGKKVVFKEVYDCWAFLPSDPQVFEKLFQPKYRSVIVPMFATNNAHAPDQTIAGMIGLQRSGCVDSWGISTQNWNWNWDFQTPLDYTNICPPDVIFRMDLCAALLGGTYFHIEGGQVFLDRNIKLTDEAKRHRDLFHEVLRKNVILPIRPERIVSISKAALVRTYNPAIAQQPKCGAPKNRHGPLQSGLLGIRYTLQTVEDDYFPSYAYGVKRYIEGLFPRLPYGLVPILPARALERAPVRPDPAIQTDGDNVLIEGKTLTAFDAKPKIIEMLKAAQSALPFTAEGCFLSAHDLGEEYRVYLVDPGYLTPSDTTVRLKIHLPAKKVSLKDLITSEEVRCENGEAKLTIPAGTFRAVSVRVVDE